MIEPGKEISMTCGHHPRCPLTTTRWVCSQRSQAEQAAARGIITREAAMKLLHTLGLPMTPPSRVYVGVDPAEPVATDLF